MLVVVVVVVVMADRRRRRRQRRRVAARRQNGAAQVGVKRHARTSGALKSGSEIRNRTHPSKSTVEKKKTAVDLQR